MIRASDKARKSSIIELGMAAAKAKAALMESIEQMLAGKGIDNNMIDEIHPKLKTLVENA